MGRLFSGLYSCACAGLFATLSCTATNFSAPSAKQAVTNDNSNNVDTGANGSGATNAGVSGGNATNADTSAAPPPPNINFGMLVNNLNCTFCHLEIHGTVVSIGTAAPLRLDSHGEVFGRWLVSGAFDALQDLTSPPNDGGIVISTGAATANYNNSGGELPVNPHSKTVSFPTLDFTLLPPMMRGTLTATVSPSAPLSVKQVSPSHVLMIGTQTHPIVINKNVLINGDLVIAGYYTGVGTIYATGNIYIPTNLRAVNLAGFPYSDDPTQANAAAQVDVSLGNKDGLGLASANNIFIGDLENYMDTTNGPAGDSGPDGLRYISIYEPQDLQDPLLLRANSGIRNVYNWLPESSYEKLYTAGTPCWDSASMRTLAPGHNWGERIFSEIDAYLYAGKAIGGIDRASTWTINGGMIAQAMHIVSGAGGDTVGAATPCPAARINFDYRLRNGLQVLEALSVYFPPVAATTTATATASGTK